MRDTHVNRARYDVNSPDMQVPGLYILYIYSRVVSFLIMVAPDADGKRAKEPVVVAAYLPYNAEGVLLEKEVKEKKGKVSPEKRREKSEAR